MPTCGARVRALVYCFAESVGIPELDAASTDGRLLRLPWPRFPPNLTPKTLGAKGVERVTAALADDRGGLSVLPRVQRNPAGFYALQRCGRTSRGIIRPGPAPTGQVVHVRIERRPLVLRSIEGQNHRAPVAQWIERRPPKPKVAGPNPVGRASTSVLFALFPCSIGRWLLKRLRAYRGGPELAPETSDLPCEVPGTASALRGQRDRRRSARSRVCGMPPPSCPLYGQTLMRLGPA